MQGAAKLRLAFNPSERYQITDPTFPQVILIFGAAFQHDGGCLSSVNKGHVRLAYIQSGGHAFVDNPRSGITKAVF